MTGKLIKWGERQLLWRLDSSLLATSELRREQ